MGVHCASCCLTGASCSAVSKGRASQACHKSWFQLGLVYSRTHKRHHSSTFSSPPSLGEAARIHTLTQLEILQAHWKCRGGRRHAWTRLSMWTQHDFSQLHPCDLWFHSLEKCIFHLLCVWANYESFFLLGCDLCPTPELGSIYFQFSQFKKCVLFEIQILKGICILFIMLRAQESCVTTLNSKQCKNCSTQSLSASTISLWLFKDHGRKKSYEIKIWSQK